MDSDYTIYFGFSNIMIKYVYLFCTLMIFKIFCQRNQPLIVAVQKYRIRIRLTKFFEKMTDPNGLFYNLGGEQYIRPLWMTEQQYLAVVKTRI